MKLHLFTFNAFQENSYVLVNENKEAIFIDPGMMDQEEENVMLNFISKNDLTPLFILNTHCHIDHILGVKFLVEKFQIPFYAHQHETVMIERSASVSLMYGIPYSGCPLPDRFIDESDSFEFGKDKIELLYVPGHSPGHLALVIHSQRMVIGGDVLFKGSVGRVDLPGCNAQDLISSIQGKIYKLPNDYSVFPGHGEATTIGYEKENNYFVSEKTVRL